MVGHDNVIQYFDLGIENRHKMEEGFGQTAGIEIGEVSILHFTKITHAVEGTEGHVIRAALGIIVKFPSYPFPVGIIRIHLRVWYFFQVLHR